MTPSRLAAKESPVVLSLERVTKRYRQGVVANDDITLEVAAGEVFGLLGPNGAGKTTLISQVIGQSIPTSGRVRVGGVDVVANPDHARKACSHQPQTQVPIVRLTPLEAIDIVGRIRGGARAFVRRRARDLLESLDLGEWADRPSQALSGGVLRLTAFCMAAIVPGRLVILDEPSNDVDPLRRRLLWAQVRRLAEDGAAVVLVSHNVLEAERAVDRLAVLRRGRVVETGTPRELRHDVGQLRLELTLEPTATLPSTPEYVREVVASGRRVIADLDQRQVVQAIAWADRLRRQGLVEEFSVGAATLEDAYVRLMQAEPSPDGEDKRCGAVAP